MQDRNIQEDFLTTQNELRNRISLADTFDLGSLNLVADLQTHIEKESLNKK